MRTRRSSEEIAQVLRGRAVLIPVGGRRRRPPKPPPTTPIEREYAKQILEIIDRIKSEFDEVINEIPALVESARQSRSDFMEIWRFDIGEGRRVRELINQVRARLRGAITDDLVEDLAAEFARRTSTHQRMALQAQTRAILGADVLMSDRNVATVLDSFISQNVALIQDVSPKVAGKIEQIVTRGIQDGHLPRDITREIQDVFGVEESRARLIARDQIGKLNGQINEVRQTELGVEEYIWRTVRDERVRGNPAGLYPDAEPSHHHREGNKYKWSDPPPGKGGPSHPGEDYQCRCYAEPVLDHLL